MRKVTLKRNLESEETQVDQVDFEIHGKKVSFWVNKDGDIGIWFEAGLVPSANGDNHLKLGLSGHAVVRCGECGMPHEVEMCEHCIQPKKKTAKYWRTS